MIGAVCVFFPAVISLKYVINSKEKSNVLKIIGEYARYTIYINLVMLIFLLLTKEPYFRFNSDMFSIKMAFTYLISSTILARFLPKIIKYFNSNIKISIKRCKK